MNQKFGKWFFLLPIGLLFLALTIAISQFYELPDMVRGVLFGIGIGLTALPLILKRIKPSGF